MKPGRELDALVAEKVDRHKRYYLENRDRILARQKARAKQKRKEISAQQAVYLKTPQGKAAAYNKTRSWAICNPEKRKAHEKVKDALRRGALIKQACQCGEVLVHAHHDDYSKPLEVKWLCRACHRKHHESLTH